MTRAHPASITETAFDCPHCGAFTTQYWHHLYTKRTEKNRPPFIPSPDYQQSNAALAEGDREAQQKLNEWCEKLRTGSIMADELRQFEYVRHSVSNLSLSQCFRCEKFAVWVYESLVYPTAKAGDPPNDDLPADVLRDYEEARGILNESPRGAAALLRLGVQKLCKHLGETGKNINNDIASLVTKGLRPMVQQSLDAVRVIGNEAVHPGSLDLRDDRDTALKLLRLVNLIAQQMITHPKEAAEVYGSLPGDKRASIESRDRTKQT